MNTPSRIRWAAVALLLGAAVVIFILDTTGNSGLLFDFLRDPANAIAGWTAEPSQNLSTNLNQTDDLAVAQAQLRGYEIRLAEAERELAEARELVGQYQALAEALDYVNETPETTRLLANVIGWDPSPLFQSLIIDKGSDDGLQIGMPVDSVSGLVGQIFRVTPNSAMVLLITDNSSSIPARLGTSRAIGVLHGGGRGGDITLDWIPLESVAEVGDVVVTSGLVGEFEAGMMVSRFPAGIVIGRVATVRRSEAEILQSAVVQSAVNFAALETVFVVTDFPRNDLSGFEDPLGTGE
ncbi:MAG: rod shape-determining protein MreC [Chloroflexi bacterium]|nr:rod shape-determining protein MreC [Chloroflexota bacterium]MDA0243626.1 rod shape-determining protein MreC [Chloroflexota bacterium]